MAAEFGGPELPGRGLQAASDLHEVPESLALARWWELAALDESAGSAKLLRGRCTEPAIDLSKRPPQPLDLPRHRRYRTGAVGPSLTNGVAKLRGTYRGRRAEGTWGLRFASRDFVPLCLSACLSVCLPVCLSLSGLLLCLSVRLSIR